MKRFIASLTIFLSLLTAYPAYADAPDAGVSQVQTLSPEEAAKLREQLTTWSKLLGPQPISSAVPVAPVDEHKTTADVADKALTMFSGAIGSLSETLKKIAPEVWRIMIRQQYASAVADIITPLALLAVSLAFYFAFRKKLNEAIEYGRNHHSDADGWGYAGFVVTYACIIGFSIWLSIVASASAAQLINPEYYAIKDLIGLVTQGVPHP